MHINYFFHAHIISRLAIRHQHQMHGSPLTQEEAQVIDNKQACLQRLINTFEHQADLFLLQQGSLDDVPIFPDCNYTQYDHTVQPAISLGKDAEQQTPPMSHFISESDSDGSGMNPANPADLSICLPSTFGWDWCVSHGVQSLALKEAQLQLAQANESIHKISLSLGFKSAIYYTQVRLAKSQKKKTRARSAIQSVVTTVHEHAQIYSMAQDAYLMVHTAYQMVQSCCSSSQRISMWLPLYLDQSRQVSETSNNLGFGALVRQQQMMELG